MEQKVKISIFGQSHSEAIGVTLDGLPAGFGIDMEELQMFMDRRAPGKSKVFHAEERSRPARIFKRTGG